MNGNIPPWESDADTQNRGVIRAAVAGVRMANAVFTVALDGILGPWHFDPSRKELAQCAVPVGYPCSDPTVTPA